MQKDNFNLKWQSLERLKVKGFNQVRVSCWSVTRNARMKGLAVLRYKGDCSVRYILEQYKLTLEKVCYQTIVMNLIGKTARSMAYAKKRKVLLCVLE